MTLKKAPQIYLLFLLAPGFVVFAVAVYTLSHSVHPSYSTIKKGNSQDTSIPVDNSVPPDANTFYVSPLGNDHNDGSLKSPLKTIQAAIEIMHEGDTCMLMEGTYRESITISKSNITIKNYSGDVVVVTGLDEVKGWTPFRNNIFQAPFTPAEKNNNTSIPDHLDAKGLFTQVFVNGEIMPQAQYPNRTGDLLDWQHHGGEVEIYLHGKFRFGDDNQWPSGHWKGGIFHAIVERKFNAVQGVIDDNNGNIIQCSSYTAGWKNSTKEKYVKNLFSPGKDGSITGVGKGFITNHINAVDAGGEWFWDKKTSILYYKPMRGQDIHTAKVEAKSRKFAFVLSGTTGVRIEGLQIVAAGIDIIGGSGNTIDQCHIAYPLPFYVHPDEYNGKSMINIKGNNNTVQNCYIAHAWGSGVIVHEGSENTIENNVIEDVNWMGTYNACIRAFGDETRIQRNTLRKSGRFLIEAIGLKKGMIAYNHLYRGMLIGQDGGAFYTYATDGAETEISFNWVHDIVGVPWERSNLTNNHNLTVGIYLDGGCQRYNIHHNVIWNVKYGVVVNADFDKIAEGNKINFNTIASTDAAVLTRNMPNIYFNNEARMNIGNKKVAAPMMRREGNVEDLSGTLEQAFLSAPTSNKTRIGRSENQVQPHKIVTSRQAGAYEQTVGMWKAGADTTYIPKRKKL